MQFRFDANQEFQQRAVASVVDVFQGMPRVVRRSAVGMFGTSIDLDSDRLTIEPARMLANVQAVQRSNHITPDAELKTITAETDIGGTKQGVTFRNLSVEMETGTGKTYVYLRTALGVDYKLVIDAGQLPAGRR